MSTPVGLGLDYQDFGFDSENSVWEDGKRKKERKPEAAREGVMDGISLLLVTVFEISLSVKPRQGAAAID